MQPPDPHACLYFGKDGLGSKVSLMGVYLTKHLDFVEKADEKCLLLGFKYNQLENMTKEEFKNGDTIIKVFVTPNGENCRHG